MRRGLTARSLLGSAFLGAVVIGALVTMTLAVTALRGAERADRNSYTIIAQSNALEKSTLDLETGLRGFLVSGKDRFLEPYQAARVGYLRQAGQLAELTAKDNDQSARALAIRRSIDAYVTQWVAPTIQLARHDLAAARAKEASGGGKTRVDAIRAQFTVFKGVQQRETQARARHAEQLGRVAVWIGFGAIVISALLILGLGAWVHRAIAVPLRRLAQSVARIGTGDLSVRVPAGGTAEVGELTGGFNSMAESLELQRDELESQTSELEAQQLELEHALAAVQERKTHIELLQQFGDRLAAVTSAEDVGAAALREIADAAGAEIGSLYLYDEREETFALVARRGIARSETTATLSPGDGLAGRALEERRAIGGSFDEVTLRLPGLVSGRDANHELHLPLVHGERTIGVVSLGRAHDEEFTPSDLALLDDLAQRAAVAAAEALALRQLELLARELETLLASTDEGIYGIDRDGRITMVNRAALDLLGYERDQLLGLVAHDAIHHTHEDGTVYPAADCPIQRVLATGIGCRAADDVYWRSDGAPFPVEFAAAPLFDGTEIAGVVVTFSEISARKMRERLRETQHAVTRALADASSIEEALEVSLAGVCSALGWQMGIAWQPEPGGSLRCFVSHAEPGSEDALAAVSAHPAESVAGAAVERRATVIRSAADEKTRSAVAVPILGESGALYGVAEFFADEELNEDGLVDTLDAIASRVAQHIERRRAEAETQRMRDEFVATVSHELRTPLTAIDGWLLVLLEDDEGALTDGQRGHLETVKRNSDRLARLVGDLLLSGQIESGQLSLELADVDVADLAAETVELAQARANAKSVTVTLDAPGPFVVRGDRARLVQLVDNLLANAVKFTPEGGDVRVEVRRAGTVCHIAVSDTGIGIPRAERDKLFQRFFRASSATESGIPGTGLGLSISKAIAESHGGTIRVVHRNGPGTTFVVELPLAVREGVGV